MSKQRMKSIEARIERIKQELVSIGEMRPGSLTQQSRGNQDRLYYQLSYTHKMKGHTEYVRPEFTAKVEQQIAAYRRFRSLVEEWTSLAIERAQMKMRGSKSRESDGTGNRSSRTTNG